ncbi:MAG: methyltransferase domain-containing protein, partial [Candidatus Izemoplasmatales bacterium]|nr:methyltransferase domain-containing protein [Candidatus Izemoplasmatales bacterium]
MAGERKFEEEAARWDEKPQRVQAARDIADAIIRTVKPQKNMTAFELGCGTGTAAVFLAPSLKHITASDSSPAMLTELKKKIENDSISNISPLLLDMSSGGTVNGKFDLIYSSLVFHHIKDPSVILAKLHSMLNPDGIIAIADLDSEDGSFHMNDDIIEHRGFDRSHFTQMLEKASFHDVKCTTACSLERFNDDGSKRGDFPVFL